MTEEKILIGRSRLRGSQEDEWYYRNNILWDAIKRLASEARCYGHAAKLDIQHAQCAGQPERVMFLSYFAGVNARKAFTLAQMVLDLQLHRADFDPRAVDWNAL